MRFISTLIVLGLSINAFAFKDDPRFEKRATRRSADFIVPVAANEIKIMAYNVENLFDAVHDEGKDDYEFLPKDSPLKKNCEKEGNFKKQCFNTDWTQDHLSIKLSQIHKAISAQGDLPDVLVVEEVENANVIGMLAKELGFAKYVVTDSPDERGVDVAVLYNENKLEFLNSVEKEISYQDLKTRNLLVVNFNIKGSSNHVLGVYANHWPSQGKPAAARMAAANTLKALVELQTRSYGENNYSAVLAGDFNTIDSDRPHPFHEVITNSSWRPGFEDAQYVFDSLGTKERLQLPPGTYFYGGDGAWNRLDHFFMSANLLSGKSALSADVLSFRVIAPEFMTRPFEYNSMGNHLFASLIFGTPLAYNHNASTAEAAGFSDHFPIVMKIKIN